MTLSPLNAILDEEAAARAGWTLTALADACLAGGARFLQVRAKQSAGGAFLRMSEAVMTSARSSAATVVVNDRVDIAKLAQADGVHLGQDDVDPADARRILGGFSVIGVSTHSVEQARTAARAPVNYIAVGPVFRTSSKQTGYLAVGTALITEVRQMLNALGLDTPIVAIGGITIDRAEEVIRAGATAVAVISDLLSTGNPEARVREYLSVLGGAHAQNIK